MLMEAIDHYLGSRRAAGFELEVPEYLLRSFGRLASERGEQHVRTGSVIEWADQAPSQGQRHHRLNTVIRFARFVRVEDEQHEIPPTDVFGSKRSRRVPFIQPSKLDSPWCAECRFECQPLGLAADEDAAARGEKRGLIEARLARQHIDPSPKLLQEALRSCVSRHSGGGPLQ